MKKIFLFTSPLLLTTPLISVVSCSSSNESFDLSLENLIVNFEGGDKSILHFKNLSNIKNLQDFYVLDFETKKEIDINYKNSSIDTKGFVNLETKNKLNENQKVLIKNKQNNNFEIVLNETKTFNKFNITESEKYLFNLIDDMSSNNIPTIIDSRNASLVLQQNFYFSLVNYYNNTQNSKNDDLSIMMIQDNIWKDKRFNHEVLSQNDIWSGIYDLDKISSADIKSFNMIKKFEDVDKISDNQYIEYLNEIIKKFNIKNKKIDFVMPDLNFYSMIRDFVEKGYSKKLEFVIKNANRITLTSDGAAHQERVIPFIVENLKKIKVKSREETIKTLEDFQNNKLDKISYDDFFNFLLLKKYESTKQNSEFNFIHFIHYDSNLQNSVMLSDSRLWNETTFSTNFVAYQNIIKDTNNKSNFVDIYSKLFIDPNLTNDKIFVSGYKHYDPNKRNAIFIGSSLFKQLEGEISKTNFSRLQKFDKLRSVVQQEMAELLKKFPTNEYNIIFKLHPTYSSDKDPNHEIAINYVKLITNNAIQDPIILSSKIPLEFLVANDYHLFNSSNSNPNLSNFIFKKDNKYQPYQWTTFFGLQATTTSIHSLRMFYQSTFNLNIEDVAKLIPFYNFPIPKAFPVIARLNEDIKGVNYYDENKEKINNLYKYFCPSLTFNNDKLKIYDSIKINFN